ncbi:hypothetical protein J6590_069344 [Homalodisca vitripennis]|nr:hypothetical protein J6590_069344 [Homalodisca vitripennis]
MSHRHIDRSSEIDRQLLRDSESESDDADPNFEIYSDHDTESEFDLDEVCEAGQHEEESDRKGRSLLQHYMSLRAQQGNLPREIRALAAKFSGTPIPAKENPEPRKRGTLSASKLSVGIWFKQHHLVFQSVKYPANTAVLFFESIPDHPMEYNVNGYCMSITYAKRTFIAFRLIV